MNLKLQRFQGLAQKIPYVQVLCNDRQDFVVVFLCVCLFVSLTARSENGYPFPPASCSVAVDRGLHGQLCTAQTAVWFYSFLVSLAMEPKDLALALIVRYTRTLLYHYDVGFPDVPVL